MSLIGEGIMSAAYHICPTSSNYQFGEGICRVRGTAVFMTRTCGYLNALTCLLLCQHKCNHSLFPFLSPSLSVYLSCCLNLCSFLPLPVRHHSDAGHGRSWYLQVV